jgi:hypothetical protein
MITVHSQEPFPKELRERLRDMEGTLFARRAIAVRESAAGEWLFLTCVVRPLENGQLSPEHRCYEYEEARLSLDILSASECERFVEDLLAGAVRICNEPIAVSFQPFPQITRGSVSNYWMEEAGAAYIFAPKVTRNPPPRRLLMAGAPFYSDAYEAAQDWLGLRVHNGHSDQSNGQVMFLLPETRAFIQDFRWDAQNEELELDIAGIAVSSESLQVKGAYWTGRTIHQLEAPVREGKARLRLEHTADRLELFLLGERAAYEHHMEHLSFGVAHCRFLGARQRPSAEAEQVYAAVGQGEGQEIEFKEFVDIPRFKEAFRDRSKFHQVLQTVAAFANAQGGTLFIGVANDCEIVGISESVAEWAGAAPEAATVDKYLGALRTRVNDALYAPAQLQLSTADIGGRCIAMVRVAPSSTPVSIGREGILYMRKGATNAKVPPGEWPATARQHSADL